MKKQCVLPLLALAALLLLSACGISRSEAVCDFYNSCRRNCWILDNCGDH